MCDPYVKECFLTAILESCCKNIQPCIVSSINFSYEVVYRNLKYGY